MVSMEAAVKQVWGLQHESGAEESLLKVPPLAVLPAT